MAVIAVDCGGSKVAACLSDGYRLRDGETVTTVTPRSIQDIPETVAKLIEPLLESAVTAIGVGVAGLVDAEGGILKWLPHSEGTFADVAGPLSERTGLPVFVDNDANAAALAEAVLGAGVGYRSVLFVGLGTGIGGGLVVDGRVERGRSHLGEIGHMIVDPSGPKCRCGGAGCWEARVSGVALDRIAGQIALTDPHIASGSEPTGAVLEAAADEGHEAAVAALDEAAWWLAVGFANLIVVLDPDVVVVGGWAAGSRLLRSSIELVHDLVEGSIARTPTPVVSGHFGPSAGLVGAAMIAEGGI